MRDVMFRGLICLALWVLAPIVLVILAPGCAHAPKSPASESAGPAVRPSVSAAELSSGTLAQSAAQPPIPTLPPPPSGDPDPVVLEVNGIQVRLSDYTEGLREFLRIQGDTPPSLDLEDLYRRRLTDDLLLYDYGRRVGLDQEPEYRRQLQRQQRQILVDYVRRTRVLAQVKVTPEDVRRYYESNGSEFATPRMVQVRAIQTSNFRDAQTALELLKASPDQFADLAGEYSIHPSRSRGGELEPFAQGTYAKPFEDVAFSLTIGEISPVIATEQGYFILEKLGEIPEQRPPLADVQVQIEERLRQQKEEAALQGFLDNLRQFGTIRSRWPGNRAP